MKISINKSAKRVLSIALALVMLVGTLFTANIGVNIIADAETAPIAEGTIDLLEFGSYLTEMGSTSTYWDTKVADNGETGDSWENAIIIDSAEEFVYLCKGATNNATKGKYYKVADGIAGFDLSKGDLNLNGTIEENLTKIQNSGKNHSGGTDVAFQGHFDGSGVTIYGATTVNGTYGGLFSCTSGTVTIKNVNVRLCSFVANSAAGGIIGNYAGAGLGSLTIENCSVTDCYIEVKKAGYGCGVGALVGFANNYGSGTNGPITVNNCYVNLDEDNFISQNEMGTQTDATLDGVHGGLLGFVVTNYTNGGAGNITNCVVIGIKPYATSSCTATNNVQHSGLETHFANVYTDQPAGNSVFIGGTLTRNFTNRVYQLTPDQMKGIAAVSNMNLPWFSVWTPGEEGEYPTFVKPGEELGISFWSGSAASEFAGGTGTKEDPFIIETADQLYRALSVVTGTTSDVETTESVAGGVQGDRMLKQGSTTVYVPVYTPYYYKVADGIDAFYLNSVYGNETLAGAKAMGTSSNKKDWKPGKSFVGYLDGNGVTIYGMYSSTGTGLIQKLDGSATVKNINFNSCYSTGSGNVALLTTNLGSYNNDSTIINVANISVRNSYIATSRSITLTQRDDNKLYQHNPGAAGIVSTNNTAEAFTMSNCLYDGNTCERAIGATSEATVDMIGAIISGGNGMNNVVLNSCVSLGAPAVDEVYVNGKEVFYNRYDQSQGFPVHFYSCYSDMPLNAITTAYPNKYDKLKDIGRITKANTYEKFDMPKLAWNNWVLTKLEDGRVIPMPTVNTADEIVGSYVSIIGSEAKNGKYASVGPYVGGTNPYTYTLKGSGTEADPFIIETDVQLARAIATGGMNLNDKLYYKLGNDIDLSGGAWITQDTILSTTASYTYRPFSGTLDGDGHTITGLSAGDSASAGLIPILAGGTVKNLHVRGATVISGNGTDISTEAYTGQFEGVDQSAYAGIIVGKMLGGSVIGCSVENATVSAANGYGEDIFIVGYHDYIVDRDFGVIENSYFVGENDYGETTRYITEHIQDDGIILFEAEDFTNEVLSNIDSYKDTWYIGGAEGSLPRLINHAEAMENVDVVGDGKTDDYSAADLTSLRNKLLRKSAYANIYGDVSRNGVINIADLAVLQRIIVDNGGWADITDGFWANVDIGEVDIYYGENDNYDAARKLELYLEAQTGADIIKHVSSSKGTESGANSDSSKVYLHANDTAETPDGKLDIIVGTLDNVDAYKSNTVATAANTYAVTYDEENEVIWIQGQNFTAVEQAVLDFIAGSDYKASTVFSCGSKELEDYKKPITVKLDTNYDGTIDTDKTFYYAWGDEFESDTIDTNNWTHNNQQTEGTQGSAGSYNNLEMAPVKDLGKVIVVENGRLSMKRAHDTELNKSDISYNGIVGSVALDVTPGEENGYSQWTNGANGANSIDADGSDQYFTSGKITTSRGMLFKQGYIEFQGQLPADGHAFPAWWLMGRPAQAANNNGYDNSLYSKVYKINNKWNGSATWNQTNLDTYKYQIPSAIYEIDIIEIMQHSDRHQQIKEAGWLSTGSYYNNDYKSRKTAVNLYFLNSTIHKWWNNGVYDGGTSDDTSDDLLYIHDWDNYKVLGGITNSAFSTTSSADSWIHNIGSTIYDFGTATRSNITGSDYWDTRNFQQAPHDKLTATRRYGFSWNTDGVSGFEATLYIYNADGKGTTVTVPIASGMSDYAAFKDGNKETEADGAIGSNAGVYSDAKVFNQYMYILFDNKYYSSNDNISISSNASANMFTDLLTCAGLKSLEIDYIRVYQEDGARDIVTKETESFNNANHFGY